MKFSTVKGYQVENKVDVIVIGGGASGLMAAGQLARGGKKVLVLEKMERCGRKILISGKGRCNITNNSDVEAFLRNVKTNKKFLFSSLYSFSPENTMDYFENEKLPLKTERGNRVFPVSEKSQDVVKVLEKIIIDNGGTILVNQKVRDIMFDENGVNGVTMSDGTMHYSDYVLVTTGGVSYPQTGSSGDGYKFAQKTGHQIVEPKPALIPIELKGDVHKRLQGLSLKNVAVSVYKKSKKSVVFSELGEMIFTHFGVSGPLILKSSFYIEESNAEDYEIHIDFKPALDDETLDKRILRDFLEQTNKDYRNSLVKLLPNKMISVLVHHSGIDPIKKVNQITAEERKTIVDLLKRFPLEVKGFRPIEEAIVTSGGIKVSDIHPSTMESKKMKRLYFAGEVVDVDAYTGGYNLQIAFSTGFLAGNSILEDC